MDETEKGKTASEKAPKRRRAAWWAEILIAIAVVLVIVGIAIPAYNNSKLRKNEAQTKRAYSEIQMAIEYYAGGRARETTTDDIYPKYLIGGSASSDNKKEISDPLLREGYLSSYPKNPFAAMVNVREIQEKYNDPLRPGGEGAKFGCRFGEDYTLMGNVLADVRFAEKHAEFGYPFYDLWPKGKRHPKEYIPGAFFYRSCPSLVSVKALTKKDDTIALSRPAVHNSWWSQVAEAKMMPWIPSGGADSYILGVYGAPSSKSLDVLGKPMKMTIPFKDEGKVYEFEDPNVTTPYDEHMNYGFMPYNVNGIPDCIIRIGGGPLDG